MDVPAETKRVLDDCCMPLFANGRKGPHLTHAHYVSEARSNKQRQKFKRAMCGKENTH
jgi:hypothetical protein